MQVIQLSYPLQFECNHSQVLAIGDFDGVHLGHQTVINRAIESAKTLHIPASVMTFHPHPREVLGRQEYSQYITPLEEKIKILESLGVDYIYVVHFDLLFSKITPTQFVQDILLPLHVKSIVVGFDFTFGYMAKGGTGTLCELSQGLYSVEVVRPIHLNGTKVSSTSIRQKLQAGNLTKVTEMLGHHFSLTGKVVSGDGRGRTIGFPTANIQVQAPYVIPVKGVYAVRVWMNGKEYNGVMNIGVKPTFALNDQATLEVHLFDFDQMIYGNELKIDFIRFIRDEQKFSSVDDLVKQIQEDVIEAKQTLVNL